MPSSTKEILQKLEDLKFKLPGGQAGIAFEFFLERPEKEFHHDDVVPWIIGMYQSRFGRACRDPDRAIRKLHDMGLLQKLDKGVYCFDPNKVVNNELYDFDESTKIAVKTRDNWKCVVCGKGEADGVELQVDHIRPRSKGGDGTLDNGQTLCGSHNYRKNKLDQISMGADVFRRLKKSAEKTLDTDPEEASRVIDFCSRVLDVYVEFGYEV
jgi:hypothetical protein